MMLESNQIGWINAQNDPIAFKSSYGVSIHYGIMTLKITLKKQSNADN